MDIVIGQNRSVLQVAAIDSARNGFSFPLTNSSKEAVPTT